MESEILVTKVKPSLASQLLNGGHEVPGLTSEPPAALTVCKPGQCVQNRIQIGRDRQSKMLEVVSRVHDNHELVSGENVVEAKRELRASDAATKRDDVTISVLLRAHRKRSLSRTRIKSDAGPCGSAHCKPRTRTTGWPSSAWPMRS